MKKEIRKEIRRINSEILLLERRRDKLLEENLEKPRLRWNSKIAQIVEEKDGMSLRIVFYQIKLQSVNIVKWNLKKN